MFNLSILKSGTKRKFVESPFFRYEVDTISPWLLREIQLEILKNPEGGDFITGTGGVRKIRVAGSSKGKSGGYRVLYLDLPKRGICHLLLIFSKNRMGNISDNDKKAIKAIVEKIKAE